MKFFFNFVILLTLYVQVKSADNIIINELDIDNGWIELKNLDPINPYDFSVNEIHLRSFFGPQNSDIESYVRLPGVIAPNGYIVYHFNTNERRKKRSAGGNINFSLETTGSRYVMLYKDYYGTFIDGLVFKVTASANEEYFSPLANEWDNKYLMYESGKIFARNGETKNSPSDWKLVTVGTPDAENGVSGDPHFVQTVFDAHTNKPLKICYDVTGESGNEIYILEDKFTDTKVTGVLLNDYYMHSIKIYQGHGLYTVNTNDIELENHNKMSWQNMFHYKNGNNLLEMFIRNENIFIMIKNDRFNKLSMMIKKYSNPLVGKYLDVTFGNLLPTRDRFSGLIGHVGKQSIVILDSIQDNQFAMLKINNETNFVELQKRNNVECWLINFKSLIIPKQPKHFILN
ncbi:DgyrCDS9214 [Dimorphilus gyrociliatus]|uniref:DgyrCDS9214 n=1 Tax=Dimorphilus gyrociliatus TaxID=2664684 RepID=A0A7I8VXN8_9ANNE|nr:DgyrCDS9214 [Dimorphilus gyrociliatus]